MEAVPQILADSGKKFTGLTKKREKFLHHNEDLVESTKLFAKVLYDVTKLAEREPCSLTLPELIIEDFDCEQVWAGVELQNQQRLGRLETRFAAIDLAKLAECSLLLGKPTIKQLHIAEPPDSSEDQDDFETNEDFEENKTMDENSDGEEDLPQNEDDILNDPDFQNMSDSDGDDLPLFGDLSDDELDDDEEGTGTFKEREKKGGGRATQVDDQFFKLSEMEKFLDVEDRKEMKNEDEKEGEDDLDLFEGCDDTEEKRFMYKEYFDRDTKGSDEQDVSDDAESDGQEEQSDEEDGDDVEMEDHSDDDEESSKKHRNLLSDDDDNEVEAVVKSSHEVAEERLTKKISRLEEVAVGEKPWQMTGEVSAPVRQENSLLAEHLDYDTAVRQAPVVTEDVARKLDDIIRQRVKDKAWDDVERKVRPVEDPKEYKKKLVLDQEKSKLSLAQVYEEEYVRLAEGAEAAKTKTSVGLLDKENVDTPAEVQEIKERMTSLFGKLDSLTHLHYTPRQKSAELKIVRNLPTIAMEEVAPTAASNATLLAPAEVVDKQKGELMETAEKTETDRKRERREKKALKSANRKNRERKEALVEKMNPGLGNKYSKAKVMKKIEQAEKQGKVTTIKGMKDKTVKSSTQFFSSLQDEVKSGAKEKAHIKKKKKAIKDINVASLKL